MSNSTLLPTWSKAKGKFGSHAIHCVEKTMDTIQPFLAGSLPSLGNSYHPFFVEGIFTNKLTNQLVLIDNYNQEIVSVQHGFTQTQLQEP